MPTGYTAELMENGMDFKTFALRCARAFGACVMQREAPISEPPKELQASAWYADSLAKHEAEYQRLSRMAADDRIAFGTLAKHAEIQRAEEYLARERAENERLDSMLSQVRAWTPPTTDHAGLKTFMVEQLTISKHDLAWDEKRLREAVAKTAQTYFNEALAQEKSSVEYSREQAAKETERTDNRNAWIRDLRSSLA